MLVRLDWRPEKGPRASGARITKPAIPDVHGNPVQHGSGP